MSSTLEYKSFLNQTDPIEIKSDFCLTNAQWRARARARERERERERRGR